MFSVSMKEAVESVLHWVCHIRESIQAGLPSRTLESIVVLFLVLLVQFYLLPLLTLWRQCRQYKTTSYPTNHGLARAPGAQPKPYDSVPRTHGFTATHMRQQFQIPVYLHQYAALCHHINGPVYRDNLGSSPMDLLFMADMKCLGPIQLASGEHPGHLVPEPWTLYLQDRNRQRGLFFMDGKEWQQYRHILNNRLAKTRCVKHHMEELGSATAHLMETLWATQTHGSLNDTITEQTYRWSLECISIISLGKRIGTFKCEKDFDFSFSGFVESIKVIFQKTVELTQTDLMAARKNQTEAWLSFCNACNSALDTAARYTKEAILEPSSRDCLLQQLLVEDMVDEDMAVRLIGDLFMAAADTTAWSAVWLLYALGQHASTARSAREQVLALVANRESSTEKDHEQCQHLTSDTKTGRKKECIGLDSDLLQLHLKELQQLSWCSNILRETMRLYPVAPFLTRLLAKESVIGGYHIPANTMGIVSVCSIGRDPKYFTNPEKFSPQRWEKQTGCPSSPNPISPSNENNCHTDNIEQSSILTSADRLRRADVPGGHASLSSMPWGMGSRNCVGRNIAETMLKLLVAHLVANFDIQIRNKDIHMKMRMISVPSEDLEIELRKHHTSPK